MFEYVLLANLSRLLPPGTDLDIFLKEFNFNKNNSKEIHQMKDPEIYFLPNLIIPESEQRDFFGYVAIFKEKKLIGIHPSGPQPADYVIDLEYLPINRKIYNYQRVR